MILFAQNKYNEQVKVRNNTRGTASRQNQEIVVLKDDMTKMGSGLNLVPKIFKKNLVGSTNNNRSGIHPGNPTYNTSQAKNRMNLTAKKKANAEIMDIRKKPLKYI